MATYCLLDSLFHWAAEPQNERRAPSVSVAIKATFNVAGPGTSSGEGGGKGQLLYHRGGIYFPQGHPPGIPYSASFAGTVQYVQTIAHAQSEDIPIQITAPYLSMLHARSDSYLVTFASAQPNLLYGSFPAECSQLQVSSPDIIAGATTEWPPIEGTFKSQEASVTLTLYNPIFSG